MNSFIRGSVSSLLLSVPFLSIYSQQRPNIILIMADDMGYSDIGCYGGEIATPNIDALASSGIRMTQFYNTSRSCPTRASLMTGLYQHQAGIGWMSEDPTNEARDPKDWDIPEYRGALNRNCVTIAEVLQQTGYHTYMAGKWHLGMHGSEKWPLQRGFEHFYGILAGACSYLRPDGGRRLTLDNTKLPAPESPYYTTDAFTDYAIQFIDQQTDDAPFFLYLAYNAPHWPLQAKDTDIEKFYKMYRDSGWDVIRNNRKKRMVELGIVADQSGFAEWENRPWIRLSEEERDMTAYRMAVYAAQVHAMDYNIGRLVDYLKKTGKYDNSLIVFLSDNGACAEPHNELGGGRQEDINNPAVSGHPSYGKAWAQVSNTPFRKYKQRAYEGGISTPLIVTWHDGLDRYAGTWCHTPAYLPDIMPTFINLAHASYPKMFNGNTITPLVGTDMLPALTGRKSSLHDYMYWEHQGNRAVRWKNWKAVWDQDARKWELYDIATDRVERNDMAERQPKVLRRLVDKWNQWSLSTNVLVPFPSDYRH